MSLPEKNSTDPACQFTTRVVDVGGRTVPELISELQAAGIEFNPYGLQLLSSPFFQVSVTRYSLVTVELTVRDLGCSQGAGIIEIYERAASLGLALCPIETAPHFRLQYLDQPEGFLGQPATRHRAPPGSITIASEWPPAADDFPKAFYLRRINGVLWLRGFVCDTEHIWGPDDHLVFCQP